MSGGSATGQRHQPSPEGFKVARMARSPGFGTPLAFPVSQWRSEWRAWPRMARYPLQWRGRAGFAPASENPHSCGLQLIQQRLVYWLDAPDARAVSNSALSLHRSVW